MKKILLWLPRVPGILFVLFTSLFSLDVFEMGPGLWETLVGLFIHLMVPSILLAVAVAIAWRWEWVGALGFGLWGFFYLFWHGEFDWIVYVLISGIPFLIAVFYLVGGLRASRSVDDGQIKLTVETSAPQLFFPRFFARS